MGLDWIFQSGFWRRGVSNARLHFTVDKRNYNNNKKHKNKSATKHKAVFLNSLKIEVIKVDEQHKKSRSKSRGRFIVPSFSICTGPDQSHRVPGNFHTDTHRERWVCTVGSPYHTLSSLACWSCIAAVADGGDGEGCGVTVTSDCPCQRWRMTYRWTRRWTRSWWVGRTGWRRRVPLCRAVWRPCRGRASCCGSPAPDAPRTARRKASSSGRSGPGPCTPLCSWRTGQHLQWEYRSRDGRKVEAG